MVDELLQLTKDLSAYAQNFVDILLGLLHTYLDSCNAMYRGMGMGLVHVTTPQLHVTCVQN